jgi:Penicillin amidase
VQTGGATFRIVVDVGDWGGSLVMNSPGQSGDPDSPHYSDLFEARSRGEAFPLCYSRARVEAVTERRIRLRPVARPPSRRAESQRFVPRTTTAAPMRPCLQRPRGHVEVLRRVRM